MDITDTWIRMTGNQPASEFMDNSGAETIEEAVDGYLATQPGEDWDEEGVRDAMIAYLEDAEEGSDA